MFCSARLCCVGRLTLSLVFCCGPLCSSMLCRNDLTAVLCSRVLCRAVLCCVRVLEFLIATRLVQWAIVRFYAVLQSHNVLCFVGRLSS